MGEKSIFKRDVRSGGGDGDGGGGERVGGEVGVRERGRWVFGSGGESFPVLPPGTIRRL